jgi:hypothetical protein
MAGTCCRHCSALNHLVPPAFPNSLQADKAASSPLVDAIALEKIQDFEELSAGGLASMTDSVFDRLVRSVNRPYHTFILFNARAPQHNCAVCA